MRQVYQKIGLFIAYALFAGTSAIFTATSLALNMTDGRGVWLIAIMVFLVAIAAGWCFSEFIKQLHSLSPSKGKTVFTLLGFLLFWGFSLMTNVHFFTVQKYSFGVLTAELNKSKEFLVEGTETSNRKIQEQEDAYNQKFDSEMNALTRGFIDEMENSLRYGFGEHCVKRLESITAFLCSDMATLGDSGNMAIYRIWKPDVDKGYKGTTSASKLEHIYAVYSSRIDNAKSAKRDAIKRYYRSKYSKNTNYELLLDEANYLEKNVLPKAAHYGNIQSAYRYYNRRQSQFISKMPQEFSESCKTYKTKPTEANPNPKMKEYNVYPSANMFNTFSFIPDVLHGYLPPSMNILGWFILSLIVDIVSYVFAYLLFKNN